MHPLRPTSRLMTPLRLCGASLLAACALVAAGCGGRHGVERGRGDGRARSASSSSHSRRRRARRRRPAASPSTCRCRSPGADEPFALSGEGAFDTTNERASFAVDMSSLAKLLGGFVAGFGGAGAKDLPDFDDPAGWKIEVVQDGDVGYVKLPAIDDQLPEGKTWVRGTAGDVKAGGFDFKELDSFTQNDPRDVLEALRGLSGDIETVGSEDLHGVDDDALSGRARPGRARQACDSRRSGRNVVARSAHRAGRHRRGSARRLDRRERASCGSCRSTSRRPTSRAVESGGVSLAFELWDYGEPVDIAVPPASQVADASSLRG